MKLSRMLSAVVGLVIASASLSTLLAQTADSPNEGSTFEYDKDNQIYHFKWWGRYGRTYFIQSSQDLMQPWNWVPVIESGGDAIKEWAFTSTADKFFVRLRYTDQYTYDPLNEDFDGDGGSNILEVQQGSDPFDYYSQPAGVITPLLTVVSGNNQSAPVDQYAAQPFVLQVTDNTSAPMPLVNAPVIFTAGIKGLISTSSNSTPTNSIVIRTNTQGQAIAYLWFQGEPGPRVISYQPEGRATPTGTISAVVLAAAPVAPVNLIASRTPSNDVQLTWTDSSSNEDGFTIYRSDDGGATWTAIASTSANTTSYTLGAASSGTATSLFKLLAVNAIGQSDPSNQEDTPKPRPALRYAVIDIDTTTPTRAMVVNNQGTVALAKYVSEESVLKLYRYKNGVLEQLTTPQGTMRPLIYANACNNGVDIDDSGNIVATVYDTAAPNQDGWLPGLPGYYKGVLWLTNQSVGIVLKSQTFTFHTVSPAPDYQVSTHVSLYGGYSLSIDSGFVYGLAPTDLKETSYTDPELGRITHYFQRYQDDGVKWQISSPTSIPTALGTAYCSVSADSLSPAGIRKQILQSRGGHTITETIDYTSNVTSYLIDGVQVSSFTPLSINRIGEAVSTNGKLYQNGSLIDFAQELSGTNFYSQCISSRSIKVGNATISSPLVIGSQYDPKRGDYFLAIAEMDLVENKWQSNLLTDLVSADSIWNLSGSLGGQSINDWGVIATSARKKDESTIHSLMLLPAALGVDSNRDGYIKFAGNESDSSLSDKDVDYTTQEKPFRFWINDDKDSGEVDTVPATSHDYTSDTIVSMRDLEDWTRLWIFTQGLNQPINEGKIKVGLKWRTIASGAPAIKVIKATDTDGSTTYLTDFAAGTNQAGAPSFRPVLKDFKDDHTNIVPVANSVADFVFKQDVWTGLTNDTPNTYFLFEGTSEGLGELVIVFLKEDGTTLLGDGPGVWLDLKNIKKMYQRCDSATAHPWENVAFEQDPREEKQAIIFVHGWRMSPEGASNFSETMYKRLWQRGYKGRFAAFHWDTWWHDSAQWVPYVGGAIDAYLANYNDSEHTAWQSASALKNFVNNIPSEYARNIVAHSMGNIVAGEALLQGMNVGNYALLQAAAPAACFDDDEGRIKQTTQTTHSAGPLTFTMWDSVTPDGDTDSVTRGLAYRGRFNGISANLINFYLPQDQATSYAWEINNDQTKPPVAGATMVFNFEYAPGNSSGQKLYKFHIETNPLTQELISVRDYYLSDPYEAMPYACRTWGKATGAFGATGGAVTGSVDLSSPTYGGTAGFGTEHSAEFDRNMHELKVFYDRLLTAFDLQGNP